MEHDIQQKRRRQARVQLPRHRERVEEGDVARVDERRDGVAVAVEGSDCAEEAQYAGLAGGGVFGDGSEAQEGEEHTQHGRRAHSFCQRRVALAEAREQPDAAGHEAARQAWIHFVAVRRAAGSGEEDDEAQGKGGRVRAGLVQQYSLPEHLAHHVDKAAHHVAVGGGVPQRLLLREKPPVDLLHVGLGRGEPGAVVGGGRGERGVHDDP